MELIQETLTILEKIIAEYNFKMKICNFRTNSDYSLGKLKSLKKRMDILWKKINNWKKK